MINFVALFLLIIIGIFVNPESWGFWTKLAFKVIILAGISAILYNFWGMAAENDQNEEADEIPPDNETDLESEDAFFDNKVRLLTKSLHKNPEILDFLRKQFTIIWNFILPHNGYLFLVLPEREALLLHKKVKDEILAAQKDRPIPLFNLIDNARGFLIENHVENGSNLIPLYKKDVYVPRSFLGFRADIDKQLHLYWIFDAEAYDFFNHEDRSTIHKINEITLEFLKKALIIEHLKEENVQTSKSLALSRQLTLARSIKSAVNQFTEFLIQEFQATKLTIAFRKDYDLSSTRGVIIYSIGKDDVFKAGYEFPLDEGLNGWVVLKNRPYLLDDIDKGEYFIPRFSRQEKTNYGLRSFLSVPVHFDNQAIGMVTLEDVRANKFSTEDKERLINYTALFSNAIDRLVHEKQIGG
ncbi:MAG: GAF domain-containing protein [Calditrichaeota bacterium]|nr:GAF domain-containing protein [Calditrichota bacterium]